ncbi:PAS domain S-box protein [Archangium violaceum]|uniref:HAMP domain-containing sensor histidine kinase n=1 Tax=Archangium violaceum TaxID=83451 RepID=UPI001952706F|nr:HAMP domain-containing sensor histidine kinase [Archangium violaceum]QRO00638.1 PAS domain S-box protein [Archangium violaceum]
MKAKQEVRRAGWHRLLSLRVLVPLLLLAYACFFGLYTLHRDVTLREQQVEEHARDDINLRMTYLQGTLEYLLRTHQLEAAREQISDLGTNSELRVGLLLDDQRRVLAATRYELIGLPVERAWPELMRPQAVASLDAARQRLHGHVRVSEDGLTVEGVFPIALGAEARHHWVGYLYLQQDLSQLKAAQLERAERSALRAGLLLGLIAGLMGVVFHFVLGQRVQRLESTARRIARGELHVRAGVRGMDELGTLGRAFDKMAERLAREQEALRRSEASSRTLIERSPDAIFVHREGSVHFANPAAIALLGHEGQEQLRGQKVDDLLMPEEQGALTEDTGESGAAREVHFRHRGGQPVLGEVVTFTIPFDGLPARVSIARDVTERKQVQEKLRSTDRMVSLGTLAAGVAHELNNPISYVLSNLRYAVDELAEQLQAGKPLTDEQAREVHQALEEALEGGERMRNIVRDLRSFSRREDERFGPVDIHAVLDSCASLARSEIRHRAQLVKEYAELPPVLGNESRLGQLFLNLLVNAAQAIPEGDAKGNRVRLATSLVDKDWVVVTVEDSGSGISPENLQRLFKPFFTTKPVGVGTGLGLSICHGIVTAMGGRIEVSSELGKGTAFHVYMPVAEQGTRTAAETKSA